MICLLAVAPDKAAATVWAGCSDGSVMVYDEVCVYMVFVCVFARVYVCACDLERLHLSWLQRRLCHDTMMRYGWIYIVIFKAAFVSLS